jgi:hypothetical protein
MLTARIRTIVVVLALSSAMRLDASVTQYWQAEKAAWFDAAIGAKTVDFVGFSPGIFMTTQYLNLGIEFVPILNPYTTEGGGTVFGLYPEDGCGLDGNGDIQVTFTEPMHAIAASGGSSNWRYYLYSDDTLVWAGTLWNPALGKFYGITTSFSFNRVILDVPFDTQLALDNVHFSTVPGPGGLALIGSMAICGLRRARRR